MPVTADANAPMTNPNCTAADIAACTPGDRFASRDMSPRIAALTNHRLIAAISAMIRSTMLRSFPCVAGVVTLTNLFSGRLGPEGIKIGILWRVCFVVASI